jgi:hypothetical protein
MLKKSETVPELNEECLRPPFKANPIPKACSVLVYN